MNPTSPPGWKKVMAGPSQAPGLRSVVLPTLVALAVAQLVVGLGWREQQEEREEARQAQLAGDANTISLKIRDRIVTYGLVLRGAEALFSTERLVTRRGWQNYVERLSLHRDYPGIQGLGFSRALRPDQVAAHEQAMRAEGVADYRVWPEGRRDLISAIAYLEPDTWRNRRALGFDMYSEPVRREAMARARDSGNLALSGKVVLVQDAGEDAQAGVLLYLPLYGVPTSGPPPFLGWVYSPLRIQDLMGTLQGEVPGHLRLRSYDGEELAAE